MMLTAACRQEVVPKVEAFRFSFGLKYSVVRDGDYCAIEQRDIWTDSQIAPPADFDEAPYIMLISKKECAAILSQVDEIDWTKYTDLSDADFETTPPGMQHRERLYVKIGDDVKVDWIKDFQKLQPSLREPLEATQQLIGNIAVEREGKLIPPDSLQLSLSVTEHGTTNRWSVTREGGKDELSANGKTAELSPDSFNDLWSQILDLRLFGAEYAPLDSTQEKNRIDELAVNINGKELVNFSFNTPYENQSRVEELHNLLSLAAKNVKK